MVSSLLRLNRSYYWDQHFEYSDFFPEPEDSQAGLSSENNENSIVL